KEAYLYSYYYDPLTRDASVLYLLSKHFPNRAKALSPRVMENIVWPLAHNQFNTLSSSMTVLALDAYAAQNVAQLDKLGIDEVHADGSAKAIAAVQAGLVQAGSWSSAATRVRFTNASSLPAWRVTSQGGYDRDAPAKAIKAGIEIVREYTDSKGKPVDKINVGEEIDVHVKIRATGDQGVGNVVIVDLLPGGFEPVIEPPAPVTDQQDDDENDEGGDSEVAAAAWRSPIGLSTSTWQPEYADIREDRVVIYGTATPDVREFVYRIKA
ncbi:MAG: alpha-2-macroglobulin family protein, partial [Rhodanobacter sp.]